MTTKKKLREELQRLVDELPDRELLPAQRYLQYLKHSADPFLRKLLDAPEDDEELTPEEEAAIEEGMEDLRAGRIVSLEEVERELGL